MNQLNSNGQLHGYWEEYWVDGKPWYKCFYNNNKKIGYEKYHNPYSNNTYKVYHII